MGGLSAGDLDREITIQTASYIQSTSGELIPSWDPDAIIETIVWAEWMPAGTSEAWKAQQRLGSYVDGVFKIYDDQANRPTPDGSRILFDGRIFDVKPYIEVGRSEGLLIPVVARGEGA